MGQNVGKNIEFQHATYMKASQELQTIQDEVCLIKEGCSAILQENQNLKGEHDELQKEVEILRRELGKASEEHNFLRQEMDH